MAFFAIASVLAVVETVAIQVAIAVGLQVLSNVLGPGVSGPRLTDLSVTTSTFGNAIPRAFGDEIRMAGNVTDSSGLIERKHKKGGFLTPKVTTYSYSIGAIAISLMERSLDEGPIEDLGRLFANGKVIFDPTLGTPFAEDLDGDGRLISRTWTKASGTHSAFETITVYGGGFDQGPDPDLEALFGVGEVQGYVGTAYIVITGWQMKDYGNRLPNVEALPHMKTGQTLADIVDVVCAAAGIDVDHDISSTQLVDLPVRGYVLGRPMSCWDALKPLQMAYNFEAAEQQGQIRFMKRSQNMRGIIPLDHMGAHAFGDQRPQPIRYSRTLETALPRQAALTFLDPARDYQANTQYDNRSEGSADNVVTLELPLALTASDGRGVVGRLLWEQWIGRAPASFNVTDQWIGIEAGRVYGIPTSVGVRRHRITRRTRGANGVIEIEAVADESDVYTFRPGGAEAAVPDNAVRLPGPVNPPLIFEPPSTMTGGGPEVWLAISGGDGTTANPDWAGCEVWVSTDDANFELVGDVTGPAAQGVLTADLDAYGGANPDAVDTLSVSTAMSGEDLASVSADDAARGAPTYYVGGEFMGAQTVTPLGGDLYDLTDLYRALSGSTDAAHLAGAAFARLDAAIFPHHLPADLVGVPLFYRFPGKGEALTGVPSYSYTPTGAGFGGAGSGSGEPTEASEDLPLATGGSGGEAGGYCLVGLWDDAGTAKLRLADCTDLARPCLAFLTSPLATSGLGVPHFSGQIGGLSGMVAGTELYLGEDGELTATMPTASGARTQVVAIATGPTTADFRPQTPSLTNINP